MNFEVGWSSVPLPHGGEGEPLGDCRAVRVSLESPSDPRRDQWAVHEAEAVLHIPVHVAEAPRVGFEAADQ